MKYKKNDYFYENIKVGQEFSCFDTTGETYNDKMSLVSVYITEYSQRVFFCHLGFFPSSK
jgi:hypothetical protein